MRPSVAPRSVPLALALASLAGCGTTPPSHFYVLAPVDGSDGATEEDGLAVVLEPIRIPPVVDRPQIVTVSDPHERNLAEFSRWAEPLGDNLAAVLAENLARRLGTERVSVLPTRIADRNDVRVSIDVVRFDAALGGTCSLVALWSLHDDKGGWLDGGRTSCEAAAGDGYAGVAEAMSRCAAQLSDTLAARIRARAGA